MGITPATSLPFWVLAGQSNLLRRANNAQAGGEPYTFTYPGALWARYLEQSDTTVSADSGFASMGPESNGDFGPELPLRWRFGAHLLTCAVGGSKLNGNWLPAQANHVKLVDRVTAALTALGRTTIDGLVWWQGEGDSNVEADALAYSANLATLMADLRGRWGATFKLVVVYTHTSAGRPFTATVRAQQEAYVAGDANSRGVNPDAYTADGAHLFTAGYVGVGKDIGAAIVTAGWALAVGS